MLCVCEVSVKKFYIHPITLIIWVWLFVVMGVMSAVSYILAIVIHEMGHFVVAKKLGYKLSKFSISPYGVALNLQEQNLDYRDEIWIALAGPLVNLITAFLVLGIWWIFPAAYVFTESFVVVSVVIALFNLLPAYPLDGGRVFVGVASCLFSGKMAKKITIGFNIVLGLFFFVLFVVFMFINFNPTYMLFSFFLFAGVLDLKFVTKFEKINIFRKKYKNFTKPVFLCVYPDTVLGEVIKKIQPSKTHIFCLVLDNGRVVNLSEKMVLNLASHFQYSSKLGELIK